MTGPTFEELEAEVRALMTKHGEAFKAWLRAYAADLGPLDAKIDAANLSPTAKAALGNLVEREMDLMMAIDFDADPS